MPFKTYVNESGDFNYEQKIAVGDNPSNLIFTKTLF